MDIYIYDVQYLRRNLQAVCRAIGTANNSVTHFDATNGFDISTYGRYGSSDLLITNFTHDEHEVREPGERGIFNDVKDLFRAVKSIPAKSDVEVRIQEEDGFLIFKFSGDANFTYKALTLGENLPEHRHALGAYNDDLPMWEKSLDIRSGVLREMLSRTKPATSPHAARVQNSTLFELSEKRISMTATDSHRLVHTGIKWGWTNEPGKYKLRLEIVNQLRMLDTDPKASITFGLRGGLLCFRGRTWKLFTKDEGSDYVNYHLVLDAKATKSMSFDRKDLLATVTRAQAGERDGKPAYIEIDYGRKRIVLTTKTKNGEQWRTLTEEPVSMEPILETLQNMSFAINTKYLLGFLRSVGTERILWRYEDASSQHHFFPVGEDKKGNWENTDYHCVIMPMRVSA